MSHPKARLLFISLQLFTNTFLIAYMFCFVAAEVVDEGNAGIVADADIDSGSEGDSERIKGHSDDLRLSDDDVSDDEGIDENQNVPPLWSQDDVVDESNAEVNATSNDIYSDDDDDTNVDDERAFIRCLRPLRHP